MRRIGVSIGVLSAALTFVAASPPAPEPPASADPQWIWLGPVAGDGQMAYFRKAFEVRGTVKAARLVTTCDNHISLFLDGRHVLQHDVWESPRHMDLTAQIRAGRHVLAARCTNDDGPAGFLLRLEVETDRGRQRVVTDGSWLASPEISDGWQKPGYDTKKWKKAHSLGAWGVTPWGRVPLDGPAESLATAAESVRVPPGFKVELLYSVPNAKQGSWVCMTPDPRGRLIVSDQYGSLYRVTPGRDAGTTRVEKLDVDLGEAQGLLYAYDSLYVTVNSDTGKRNGLYRLRDTRGHDQFDEVKLLKRFEGRGEHGPHAIRLGPDGLLYVIAGNFTRVPEGVAADSPHKNYREDLLLPRNPDGNGFATGIMAPGGWVARTDKEGKRWELFCGGFRNPYDLDFNDDGELFTYDADMEWDTGTPWYRPTRVNHVVSGAEFGWRYGTGKWPAYYADSVGAVVDIGLGSPTGLQFGTAARFPAKYQRAFFMCDWTYGKVYAVFLQPSGASYTGTFEVFAEGKPLPVTDLIINHDGAIYFTTGGRRMQSGLYRVTYVGKEPTDPAPPVLNEAAARARRLRHQLERFHGHPDPSAVSFLWPHLNSSDRAIRYAARIALEWQDLAGWKERALEETRPTARVQALLALARTAGPDLQADVLSRLNGLLLEQLTEEQMLDALRTYEVAFIRMGGRTQPAAEQVRARLSPLFPGQSEWVNRELCSLLVYLNDSTVVHRAMKLLKTAQTQQDQMYYVFVLRNTGVGWTLDERKAYFSWLNLAENKYQGGASFKKFIRRIREDAIGTVSPWGVWALRDVLRQRENIAAVGLETTRQFVHNWQMADLEPLLDQVDHGRSWQNGKRAYEAAQCAKCHRFRNEGGDTGPDITGVGNRFDARYILESIVLPSKVISDQYAGKVISTRDGRVVTGRVVSEDARVLRVRTDPFARELTEVLKEDVDSIAPSPVSEMPQGLINVLTKEEVLDLVAYLRSGGDPKDKAFVRK